MIKVYGTASETATEGDRGEDNKDRDWLIEESIARQVNKKAD